MSKIDLSKAKIGDKFRTRKGYVVALKDIVQYMGDDVYILTSSKACVYVFQNGKMYKDNKKSEFDLVEQVFDDEKDTTDREIVEAMNQATKELSEKAAEREKELQRRQEVVELAEKLWLRNLKDLAEYSYYDAFKDAETFIKLKSKYLKEGSVSASKTTKQ